MPVKSTLDSWRKSYKEFEKPDKRSHTYTHYTWIALNSSTHLAQTNPFPPFSQHQTDNAANSFHPQEYIMKMLSYLQEEQIVASVANITQILRKNDNKNKSKKRQHAGQNMEFTVCPAVSHLSKY